MVTAEGVPRQSECHLFVRTVVTLSGLALCTPCECFVPVLLKYAQFLYVPLLHSSLQTGAERAPGNSAR